MRESFKLTSATWVHLGELRLALTATCTPLEADAVITGHNRSEVAALVWPAPDQAIDEAFRAELALFCEARMNSSTRIARLLVLDEPPSIDAGEIPTKATSTNALFSRAATTAWRNWIGAAHRLSSDAVSRRGLDQLGDSGRACKPAHE